MFVFCSVYFSIHLAYQRQCIFTCRMRLRIHRSIFCVSFTINNFKLFLNKQLHQKLWCVNNGEVFCTLQRKICTLITIQLKWMQLDRSDVPRTTSLIDEPSYQSGLLVSSDVKRVLVVFDSECQFRFYGGLTKCFSISKVVTGWS